MLKDPFSYEGRIVPTNECKMCGKRNCELTQDWRDKRQKRPIHQTGVLCNYCYEVELMEYREKWRDD